MRSNKEIREARTLRRHPSKPRLEAPLGAGFAGFVDLYSTLRHFAERDSLPIEFDFDHAGRAIEQGVEHKTAADHAGFRHVGFSSISGLAGVAGIGRLVSTLGAVERSDIDPRADADEKRQCQPKPRENVQDCFSHDFLALDGERVEGACGELRSILIAVPCS